MCRRIVLGVVLCAAWLLAGPAPDVAAADGTGLSVAVDMQVDVTTMVRHGAPSLRLTGANAETSVLLSLHPGHVRRGPAEVTSFQETGLDGTQRREVTWLATHYFQEPTRASAEGLTDREATRAAYQFAVWNVTGDVDLTAFREGPAGAVARYARYLVREAEGAGGTEPVAVDSHPALELLAGDEHVAGRRYKVVLRADRGGIDGQFVTVLQDGSPLRVLRTTDGGSAFDLDYEGSQSTLRAVWDRPLPAGTLVTDSDGNVLLMGAGMRQSLESKGGPLVHKAPGPKDSLYLAVQSTLHKLPLSLQATAVLLVAAVGFVASLVSGLALPAGARGRPILFAVAAVVALGVAVIYGLGRLDAGNVELAWRKVPAKPVQEIPIPAVGIQASSTYYHGDKANVYAPECALPGHATRSGRPWMSANNGGLPQMLHLTFGRPVIVSSVQVVPGWVQGDPVDFEKHPKPSQVVVIDDAGIPQTVPLDGLDTYSASLAAMEGKRFPLPRPVATSGLFVVTERVRGDAQNYVALSLVQAFGDPAPGPGSVQAVPQPLRLSWSDEVHDPASICP